MFIYSTLYNKILGSLWLPNDLKQILGSQGPAQNHLAAKGCLGFVILMKEINDAFNYGNSAAEVGRLLCSVCCSQSPKGRCRGRMYYVRA